MQQHETDLEERQLRKRASQKRGLARYLAFRATEEMFGDPVFTTVEGDEVRQVVEFVLIDSCHGGFAGKVSIPLDGLGVVPEYWTFVTIIPSGFCEPLNIFK